MQILEMAQRTLERYALCNNCLGRQFALVGYGVDNGQRGEAIKLTLTMKAHQLSLLGERAGVSLLRKIAENGAFDMASEILRKLRKRVGKRRVCHLCEGRFELTQELVDHSVEELQNYEYNTFLVGIELPTRIEEREDEFKAEFEVKHGENMRNEFSRTIGKKLSEMTRKTTEYARPEVVVLINPFTKQVVLQVNPLYIMGKYKKLIRGIPQSKWHCRECRGRGCPQCNWTGKMYPESVEEIIAGPTLRRTYGEGTAFHAAGREDIDARMLGRGRPFVIEVKKPRKRFMNLRSLARTINKQAGGKVKVLGLRVTNRDMVRKLKKAETAEKIYKAIVGFNRNIGDEELGALEKVFSNTVIRQQTPLRVLHRRADRIRERYIYKTKIERLRPNCVEMRIHCQGGLYIKELITGDEGRTNPNVTKVIAAKAAPLELDVLNVIAGEP
ncbi:MAG: tRNA pseudouridine(54/55) synthase Pus10 [Candidatus Bathyarchaeota archaeon]|nr:MAG: tRNA pseudouridine(54/55) synthase Pus10 [Candidatus Bathyarchaeota archaeon]